MMAVVSCTADTTLARTRARLVSNPESPEYGASGQTWTSGDEAVTQPGDATVTLVTRPAIITLENTSRYRAHSARPYAGGPQISPSGVRSNLASDVSRTRISSAPDRCGHVPRDMEPGHE